MFYCKSSTYFCQVLIGHNQVYIFLYCLGEKFRLVTDLRAIAEVSPRLFMIHAILVLPQLLKT